MPDRALHDLDCPIFIPGYPFYITSGAVRIAQTATLYPVDAADWEIRQKKFNFLTKDYLATRNAGHFDPCGIRQTAECAFDIVQAVVPRDDKLLGPVTHHEHAPAIITARFRDHFAKRCAIEG